MEARVRRSPTRPLALLLLLAPWGLSAARGEPPLALAVRGDRCEAVLDTSQPGAQFYLILGALARSPGPFRVTVQTTPTETPAVLPQESPAQDAGEAAHLRELGERLERARQRRSPLEPFPPLAEPPKEKVFHLFTGDQDFQNSREYTAVVGELRRVGRHCQVYVDRAHPDPHGLQPTVDDAVRTFDEEVYPRAREKLGQALDVDRDGRFTILFSGCLDRLQRGQVALGGFVRGSDFYTDLAAPFGNRCDVLYLNTNLKPGPHLRTLVAHEYVHAVVFSEHVFGDYLPGAARQDEEAWLNEALAHLNEEAHGYSWSNLDYRVSAFLNAPSRYRLVVPDYYASGLWRDPGTRGSAYLFLRWCRARHPGLPARLVRSNLQGVHNLEVAAQREFAELFREWSAALLLDGARAAPGASQPGLNLRRPLGSRLLCGPRFDEVPLQGGRHELWLAGTGIAYVLLHSPAGSRARVVVTASPAAELQVSLVPVPPQAARLSLRCESAPDGASVRLSVTAHGTAVQLEEAAWERLVPKGEPADTSFRPGAPAEAGGRAWFGEAALKVGETRRSAVIPLAAASAGGGPLVFKVAGTDAAGNRVAGWAVPEPARPAQVRTLRRPGGG